jgi:hypothetical protein
MGGDHRLRPLPEHSSLYCAEAGVLISGDMLLPRISTNVSVLPPRRMTIRWAVSWIRSAVSSACLKHLSCYHPTVIRSVTSACAWCN